MTERQILDWRELPAMFLAELGLPCLVNPGDHPALAWRRAGLTAVTGRRDGKGLICPAPLTTLADAALSALKLLSGSDRLPASGALLLGERARMIGLARGGDVSANGSCRLLHAADGCIALNLPRADDWDLATAMVQEHVGDWKSLGGLVATWPAEELAARGRLLGLAIAQDQPPRANSRPVRIDRIGPGAPARRGRSPLVVDLSALWGGPLAGSLLGALGAEVVKVESSRRPDGARSGDPAFFALLNGSKQHLALDFADPADLAQLRALIARADIIIETSRPRALEQLGVDARAEVARGATWISLTAHGREGEARDWIGFGDDAAVAGGLSTRMRDGWGATLFAGDAVADPLTGIVAALAGWNAWREGGGRLVSVAMADVVSFACRFGAADRAETKCWQALADADAQPLYPLRSPV